MNYRICDLNKYEKPREKLSKFGVTNLTDEELIALLLRSGGKDLSAVDLARKLLEKFQGLLGLASADLQQLTQIKFVDIAKASSLIAAIEIGIRVKLNSQGENVLISKPEDIVNIVKKDVFQKQKEYLYLITLNSRSRLISKDSISIGTINETLLSQREIFRQAFSRNAVSIVLVHNHPSNDSTPSDEDVEITQQISDTADKIGIPLLDHLIVTDTSFLSMKSAGLLSKKFKGGD